MIEIKLIRTSTGDQGTYGALIAPGFFCHTLELPWRDNRPNVSCIPRGSYALEYVRTRRTFGGRRWLYWVKDVPGRSGILMHAGTFAGDTEQGLKSNVLGCIIQGMERGRLAGQRAVLRSREAVRGLIGAAEEGPARLRIFEAFGSA